MKAVAEDFLPLEDVAARAVAGPRGRHAALIEDAFQVMVETPGGGVRFTSDGPGRARARRTVETLAERALQGLEVTEGDVRTAILQARTGSVRGVRPAMPVGRRGAVAPKTEAQARYLDLLAHHDLVFGIGPAGTGKTFLAVAHGVAMLSRGEVDRLVITRPAVEAGERLGFLPGDLKEKVDPYLAPIWEALSDLMGREALDRRRDRGEVEVAPIAFMRGRTLAHAYVIVDEAQNATRLQMKMILTRLGEGARMAVTGDPSQIDLPHGQKSGLVEAARILDGVEGIARIRFQEADVVRHDLVRKIVTAYDADLKRSASPVPALGS